MSRRRNVHGFVVGGEVEIRVYVEDGENVHVLR